MSNDFSKMLEINVNGHIKDNQGQKYLPWVYAWKTFKTAYPDANYRVIKAEFDIPYVITPLGIMVNTEVTANGETIPMHLPVMNGAMKAMKTEPYSYKVKEYKNGRPTGQMIDKYVEAATMVNINKAIMRCLTKNIGLFGIGLYIYEGQDGPDIETVDSKQLQAIMDKIKEKGLILTEVTKDWQIDKIADLYAVNFDNRMQWLEGYK